MARDLVAIGGSAGALPALIGLLGAFAPDGPVSVFVVLHRGEGVSRLVDILQDATAMHVCEPGDGDPVRPGTVYIAPADRHLLVGSGHVHLRRGPRENNFRPAIDPLFRSLAVAGSTRVTGVVLSGHLDDGAAGLRAIRNCGGCALVQDPGEAASPDMPRAAISAVGEPDVIAPAEEIGERLGALTASPAPPPVPAPDNVRRELLIASLEGSTMAAEDRMGALTPYNCPDCNGVLWQLEDGPLLRFRCHTGHAYSSKALLARQDETLEQSLYEVLRGQRERAALLRQMADRDPRERERWLARARGYEEDAESIEAILAQRAET